MNNIDKILKEALQGFEPPFDARMWDKVSGQLSPLEDAFRDAVSDHEAPYNAAAWSAIKNKINSTWSLTQWLVGSAAAIAVVTAAIVFWPSTNDNTSTAINEPIANQNEALASNVNSVNDNTSINSVNQDEIKNEDVTNVQDLTPATNPGINLNPDPNAQQDNDNNIVEFIDVQQEEATRIDQHLTDQTQTVSANPIDQKHSADFSLSAYTACVGNSIIFNPKLTKSGTNHTWDFGDGTISYSDNVKHSYSTPGVFEVTHTLKENATDKIIAIQKDIITVNALPNAEFYWERSNELIPVINLINLADENDKLTWKIDGQIVSDQTRVEHTFREKGWHTIELSTVNENGCSNIMERKIEINENYNLFAPTMFTPNGDGINDEFIPKALLVLNNEFKMIIYDEQGNPVFQTTNANIQWDGRNSATRAEANSGAYIWTVSLNNGNGITENYSGQVFLAR